MNLVALAAVGGGGALGALARYGLSLVLPRQGVPVATLLANLLGCLVMGAALQWLADADWFAGTPAEQERWRLLFAVGFCGSFTTLSALVFEMGAMLQRNDTGLAFGYLLVTVLGGFACFYGGVALSRLLLSQ